MQCARNSIRYTNNVAQYHDYTQRHFNNMTRLWRQMMQ